MDATDLSTWTPSEVDTALYQIQEAAKPIRAKLDQWQELLARELENLAKLAAGTFKPSSTDGYQRPSQANADKYEQEVQRLTPLLEANLAQQAPYKQEYIRRGGWPRFWKVTNTGGHVHDSQDCSSCYVTTDFAWKPAQSGNTPDEIVEAYGCYACTICFPTAPVHPRYQTRGTIAEEEDRQKAAEEADRKVAAEAKRAAQAAAQAAREEKFRAQRAAFLEKAIWHPDGWPYDPLRFGTERLETARSAEIALTGRLARALSLETEAAAEGPDGNQRHANHLLNLAASARAEAAIITRALAMKRGTTAEEVLTWAAPRVRAKAKKEYGLILPKP